MAGKFDAAIKDLMWRGMPALLGLLVKTPVARILSPDFSVVKERRPDLLAEMVDRGLLHLEFQAQDVRRFKWRMLDYYGEFGNRYDGVPVTQIVIYLGEKRSRMETSIDHPNLNFSFELIHISDIDPTPLLDSPSPDDAVLAILCRNGNTRQNIRRILLRLAELDPGMRRDAAARLVILAQLRRAVPAVVEEVEAMGNITFDIKDHPVLNDIFEKGVVEGFGKGRLEGELLGETRGRAETLLRLLRKRFDAVPDAAVERVHAAGIEDLDRWADAVLDAPSLDAVFEPSKH
jgi:predicted transposase YdaD